MSEMITINVWVSTNICGSTCDSSFEIEKKEWESMSDDKKDELCHDTAMDNIDWGYDVEGGANDE